MSSLEKLAAVVVMLTVVVVLGMIFLYKPF
jgi:hypothetical protein